MWPGVRMRVSSSPSISGRRKSRPRPAPPAFNAASSVPVSDGASGTQAGSKIAMLVFDIWLAMFASVRRFMMLAYVARLALASCSRNL